MLNKAEQQREVFSGNEDDNAEMFRLFKVLEKTGEKISEYESRRRILNQEQLMI